MRYILLILVFALASTANADISIYLNNSPAPDSVEILVDEILTIQIYSDDTVGWLGYIILEEGSVGAFGNHWPTAAAGGAAEHLWYSEPGWGSGFEVTTAQSTSPTDIEVGIQHIFEYSSSEMGTAVVSLWDDRLGYDKPVDTLDITVVPEPATIVLLALGGLTILKKHRV